MLDMSADRNEPLGYLLYRVMAVLKPEGQRVVTAAVIARQSPGTFV
jgi:hypothetical protein